ncbi:MAG TPA: glycoside hydrolase family 130 protein [Saprospiraceae bacterium]|nr:glycoside hydrolase family 130 protein [Saprospiraceae bacterium]
MSDLALRFPENPILTPADITPSQPDMKVECVLNPGAFTFDNKTWLLLRVAERPEQKPGKVSFPILNEKDEFEILEFSADDPELNTSDPRMVVYKGVTYLSTVSHLRLLCSEDKVHFHEPDSYPTRIFGKGSLESFGIEDCRVVEINKRFYLTYTEVSENGVGVGLMHTDDWQTMHREGMILPPHNKDCALFPEKVHGKYYCLHRPSGIDIGGNFIWIASSTDLKHWGDHRCILNTRPGSWDSARIGAGASPIKTKEGWLEIYHGANAHHRYCLGAILMDPDDPVKIIARSKEPIMEPRMKYEQEGFFGHVVFTNGHIIEGDTITMYYGASDTVICGATLSIKEILASLDDHRPSPNI